MITGGGYLRLTPSVPLLVQLVPVSTGGGVPVFSRVDKAVKRVVSVCGANMIVLTFILARGVCDEVYV
jgi:hypothetical protein